MLLYYWNKHTQSEFLCFPLTSSLLLWASAPGFGHRRWDCCCRLPPHHHCVMQAMQEEETETPGREWGSSPQRKKRPHCVVRPREKRQGSGRWGIKRGTEVSHTLSLALCLNSGDGMWCSFMEPGAFFPYWMLHFNISLQVQSLDPKPGQLDVQLNTKKLRMHLCVERYRYRTLVKLLCIYNTMCLSFFGEKQLLSPHLFQLNGQSQTFPV